MKVLIALVNDIFNSRGILNDLNEALGEKHFMLCHAISPPERSNLLRQERYIFTKELNPSVDCASRKHWRKILKVTALSKKVNIKSHTKTSKYMWERYANFHIFAST